jgi:uncharacterized sulfatase
VVPGDLVDTVGDWRENYANYLGCCHSLDENLGRIRNDLDRLGLAHDTLVIYTSDHGSHFRTRNSEYKRSCHEACIRIPMIACGPRFRGGQVISGLVSLIDLPPTILSVAGAEVPATVRGRPLQELVKGTATEWRDDLFLQISESQVGRAIRTERWKYSVRAPDKDGNKDPMSDHYVEEYLYDLEHDPHERNNLVADAAYVKVRAELGERLKQSMAKAGEAVPTISPGP